MLSGLANATDSYDYDFLRNGLKIKFHGKWSELRKSERRKPKRTPKTP